VLFLAIRILLESQGEGKAEKPFYSGRGGLSHYQELQSASFVGFLLDDMA